MSELEVVAFLQAKWETLEDKSHYEKDSEKQEEHSQKARESIDDELRRNSRISSD